MGDATTKESMSDPEDEGEGEDEDEGWVEVGPTLGGWRIGGRGEVAGFGEGSRALCSVANRDTVIEVC